MHLILFCAGWSTWTDWGACSVTCGGGTQIRYRYCSQPPCIGFNKEKRKCNIFSCKGKFCFIFFDRSFKVEKFNKNYTTE